MQHIQTPTSVSPAVVSGHHGAGVAGPPTGRIDSSAAVAAVSSALVERDVTIGRAGDAEFAQAMAVLDRRPEVRETKVCNFFQAHRDAGPFLKSAMALGHARAYFYEAVLGVLYGSLYQISNGDREDHLATLGCVDMPTYLMKFLDVYQHDSGFCFSNDKMLIAFRKAVRLGLPAEESDVLVRFMQRATGGDLAEFYNDKTRDAFKYHWNEIQDPTDINTVMQKYKLKHYNIDDFVGNLIKYECDIIGWDVVMLILVDVIKEDCLHFSYILEQLPSCHWVGLLAHMEAALPELATQLRAKIIADKDIDLVDRLDVAFGHLYVLRENAYDRLFQGEKVESLEALFQTPRGFAKYTTIFNAYQRKFEACLTDVGEAFATETNPDQLSRLAELEQDLITRTTAYRETYEKRLVPIWKDVA